MRDYAELINQLRECGTRRDCLECPYDSDKSYCIEPRIIQAADAIEELLDELTTIRKQFPRWTSVEERLPHYLDYVLCVNKFGIQMVGYLTDYKEGGFRCESGMDSCDYITHWMPLPTPPKGVE